MTRPPAYRTYLVDLPLCSLHVMEAGDGPPLIIVPATISELENWVELIQFMAQWFRVFFFELPGHGKSTPFSASFTTAQVAQTVEDLADELGFERFNLMGFSFGGILAMKTFLRLQARIDRLVLISPCLTHRAIRFSPIRKALLRRFNQFLSLSTVQAAFHRMLRNRPQRRMILEFLHRIGRLERTVVLDEKLSQVSATTLNVLSAEIEEILTGQFPPPAEKFTVPCYFAMSVFDPILDYQITLNEARTFFTGLQAIELYYPFHQPPRPFTFEELNRDFYRTVDEFLVRSAVEA